MESRLRKGSKKERKVDRENIEKMSKKAMILVEWDNEEGENVEWKCREKSKKVEWAMKIERESKREI